MRINALITLYNPTSKNIDNCRMVSQQVDRLFLCDNSQQNNFNYCCDMENAIYSYKGKNLGLSKAFNTVLKNSDIDWKPDDLLVFFDQDSSIEDNYINSLIQEFLNLEASFDDIGCFGPVFFNTSNGKVEVPHLKTEITQGIYKVNNIITSSLVIRYEILEKIDFFNERLFLDFVDWDLCWRIKGVGLNCCITDKIVLHHSIGEGEKKVGIISLRIGAPIREYYQTRDALYLWKKDYVPFKMRFKLFSNFTIRPILHILFLNDRKNRIHYIKQGFKDYRLNKHGIL